MNNKKTAMLVIFYPLLLIASMNGYSSDSNLISYKVQNIHRGDEELSMILTLTNKGSKTIYLDIFENEILSVFKGCKLDNSIDIWKTFPPPAYVGGKTTYIEPDFLPKLTRLGKDELLSFPIRIEYPFSYTNIVAPSLKRVIETTMDEASINIIIGADLPFMKPPVFKQGTIRYSWRHLYETGYFNVSTADKIKVGNMKELVVDFTDKDEIKKTVSCNFKLNRSDKR